MRLRLASFILLLGVVVNAQAASFDSPSSSLRIPSDAAVDVPKAIPSIVREQATAAAPEYAYENLLDAPLWRKNATAASVDLRPYFTAARSQGNRNMCNVFAATSLAEFLVNRNGNSAQSFSEEFLFYNTKYNYTSRPELQVYKTQSGLAGYAAVLALEGGVVAAVDWPFNPNWKNPSPVPPVTDAEVGIPPQGLDKKVLAYKFSTQAIRRADIKKFIAVEHRPVVVNLMVYSGDWAPSGPGRFNQPTQAERDTCFAGGSNCGGHVVLLVGYDSKTDEFIFRNSWGDKWGEKGYGRVSDKYVQEDCEMCNYLTKIAGFDTTTRTMLENGLYGWSAQLK